MATSSRGFASMDADKQKDIASKGGKATGINTPSMAGKKGVQAQPIEAKAEGGRHSHRNG